MRRKTATGIPSVGGCSLLVAFVVLCLGVFAMLALATARAEVRLNETAERTVTGWYEADAEAEIILAQLRAGTVPAGVNSADGVWSYSCPVSDHLELRAEIRQSDCAVLRWQLVSTMTWESESPELVTFR